MATGDLNETAFVVLDGSGNGTARLGPLSAREVWHPAVASVRTTLSVAVVNEAQCSIYVGQFATQENYRDGTFSGSSGDATDKVAGSPVKKGDYIWAIWSGGDAGKTASLNVIGTKDV